MNTSPSQSARAPEAQYELLPDHLSKMDLQRRFLPQNHNSTPLHPILTTCIKAEIKGPDHLSEDEAHLSISEIL